jgi:predicted DNA-binding protein (MmcQ/YjbR family)
MPTPSKIADSLVDHALKYPETRVDHPWGETAVKVREKAFLFLGKGEGMSFSVKLPASADFALQFPFAEPTHYGLGKHGWVTIRIAKGDELPLDVLKKFIDESFRAVAPKTLVKSLTEKTAKPPAKRKG